MSFRSEPTTGAGAERTTTWAVAGTGLKRGWEDVGGGGAGSTGAGVGDGGGEGGGDSRSFRIVASRS